MLKSHFIPRSLPLDSPPWASKDGQSLGLGVSVKKPFTKFISATYLLSDNLLKIMAASEGEWFVLVANFSNCEQKQIQRDWIESVKHILSILRDEFCFFSVE